jgi:two-component system phosphate regulon response regulator PhoB
MSRPILIIVDDPGTAESLRYNLERQQLEARIALTGEEGLAASLDPQNPPSLIILDFMLAGMNGLEVCRRLRREPTTYRTPIIMVAAHASNEDAVTSLDLGADDFLTKPFSPRELMARIRAVLRRADPGVDKSYEDNCLKIDFAPMRVFCRGEAVRLNRKEFSLLTTLVGCAGQAVTRRQLLDDVWGCHYCGDPHTLDVHINRLREHLGPCGDAIETVVGTGYRFVRYLSSSERLLPTEESIEP